MTSLLPNIALRVDSSRDIVWRMTILVLVLGGLGAACYQFEMPLNTPQLVLVAGAYVAMRCQCKVNG